MRPDLEESFDAFVRARGEHHLRVAALLTGSAAEAEDLVQSSLVKLFRAWPRLDVATASPDAYLRKIIVNTRRSWWQTRWRRESPAGSLAGDALGDGTSAGGRSGVAGLDGSAATGSADPADGYALGALVRSALAALPRQQRAVLVLRYLEDLPEAEVASLLGCSVGTVKTHAHRGLRALRATDALDAFAVNEAAGSDGEKR
jgi:RNA polymerase sigma factor (sigma-70 family)